MSAKDAKKYTIVSLNTNKQSDVYKKMEATATCWRARQSKLGIAKKDFDSLINIVKILNIS